MSFQSDVNSVLSSAARIRLAPEAKKVINSLKNSGTGKPLAALATKPTQPQGNTEYTADTGHFKATPLTLNLDPKDAKRRQDAANDYVSKASSFINTSYTLKSLEYFDEGKQMYVPYPKESVKEHEYVK